MFYTDQLANLLKSSELGAVTFPILHKEEQKPIKQHAFITQPHGW